jgi:hypothetical protein
MFYSNLNINMDCYITLVCILFPLLQCLPILWKYITPRSQPRAALAIIDRNCHYDMNQVGHKGIVQQKLTRVENRL